MSARPIVQRLARRVDEHDAVLHAGELLGTDHPGSLGRDRGVQRHNIGLLEHLVE